MAAGSAASVGSTGYSLPSLLLIPVCRHAGQMPGPDACFLKFSLLYQTLSLLLTIPRAELCSMGLDRSLLK